MVKILMIMILEDIFSLLFTILYLKTSCFFFARFVARELVLYHYVMLCTCWVGMMDVYVWRQLSDMTIKLVDGITCRPWTLVEVFQVRFHLWNAHFTL